MRSWLMISSADRPARPSGVGTLAAWASSSATSMSFSAHFPVLLPQRESDQLAPLPWPSASISRGMSTPSLLRQGQRLEVGRHAGPQQHVVDGLGDLAGADARRGAAPWPKADEHRPRPVEPRVLAAGIDRHRAVIGRLLAEHHRRIETPSPFGGAARPRCGRSPARPNWRCRSPTGARWSSRPERSTRWTCASVATMTMTTSAFCR